MNGNVFTKATAEMKIERMERKLRQALSEIDEVRDFINEFGLADGPYGPDGESIPGVSINERVAQVRKLLYPTSSKDFGTSMVGALDYLRQTLLFEDEPQSFEPWKGHLNV
jgi:hypothetical protein